MKKLSLLVALMCASMMSFGQDIYDVNFALTSEGSSATATSGNAAAAIDGNNGSRWESASADPQVWTLDMGQVRAFNTIQIRWEGAYGKTFTLEATNDTTAGWTLLKSVEGQSLAGFPYEQTIEFDKTSARFIRFTGIERGTGYGYSFWEFRVFLLGKSVLSTIEFSAAAEIAKVGEGVALTVKAKNQAGIEMAADIAYEVTPADAGSVVDGKYVPAKVGEATIIATSGEVKSAAVSIFGYAGDNLALSTDIILANKVIAQSEFAPNGTDAFHAVDGNEGSVWQGSPTNGTTNDEAARTYDAWFVLDLGAFYSIDLITIKFEGACAQNYHIDFSADNTSWELGYNYEGNAGIFGRTDMLHKDLVNKNKVRYVRFWSTKAATEWGMKVFEFKVFGQEWKDSGDTEKPVMGAASLESNPSKAAVINVAATDNGEIVSYRVVDAANNIDIKLNAVDGKITVTGLEGGKTYNFVITVFDANGNESANNATVSVTTDAYTTEPTVAAPVPTWPAEQVKSLYSNSYPFAPASLNSYNEGWWAPPVMTEKAIEGNHYLHYNLAQDGMIGVQFAETSVITMEYIHIDVWASKDGSISFRPITIGGPEPRKTLNLVGGKWNSFDIPMADFAGHDWTKLFQYTIEFWNAGGLTGEYIAVDNVFFYRTTAIEDTEKPANVTATAVSADYFSALIAVSATDNMGVVNYTIKDGDKVLATGAAASGMTTSITVPGLLPNTEYTLAVIASDDKGNAAEPVSVTTKTLAAPAPAPAPDLNNKEVVPVFTDAVEGGPFINIGGWGQSTAVINGQLAAGDNVMFLTNMNYLGWELAPAVDATGMEYLHVDFYTTTMNSVNVTPISPGKEGVVNVALKAGEWTSADIALVEYAANGIEWNNIFQFKFFDAAPNATSLFIDNVYFYKAKTNVGFENVESKNAAIKVMENGVVYIIRDGVKYTTFGQKVQ